ncbi:MAG TPA: aldehyde dehydrogenase family protein, partial [Thermoleophilaceae bacterium]
MTTETIAPARTVASIIGGRPRTDAPGGRLVSTNPAHTDDVVAEVLLGDAQTFVDACGAAREAQKAWAATPAPIRGRAIQQIGRLVEDNKEALARLVTREIGKPYPESLGEVQEVIDTCNFFVSEGRRLYGQTVPSEMPDKQLFTFRTPVGVAAIVTAGNFPVAVPSWYLVPALLCGNAVVWKPAEYAPALGEALSQLFLHGGLPDGVFNLVQCEGAVAFEGIEQALEQGLVDKVGFTGSSDVGRKIGELCGRHLQQPCLELGGKNPLVVMPDADLALAVEGALFSGFGTAGQRCTSLGTAIVHDSVYDDFVGQLTAAVESAPIGDPTRDVLYGPMIHERFLDRFLGWLELIQDHHRVSGSTGTGRITADNPRDGFVGDPEAGLFCHPTIVSGVMIDDEIYRTETFGPIIGVAKFSDFDEAMELANNH